MSTLDVKDAPVVEHHSEKSLDGGLSDDSDLALSPADERKLKRKIDWNIVPYCSLLYLLSFLDRVNIGQARTAGLETDLKLVRNQYDIALTVFFVSYVAFEIPSNILLRRFKPHRIITLSMIAWAIVMTLMGIVHNFAGLAAARFMLGLAEGGLFPGINLLLTHWYTRNESNIIVSIFFAGATLAGAWGGLLAYGIRHMAGVGGKNGWSWIFILEGLLTFLCALPAWWLVPDFPEDAKFLTERERSQWMARLRRSQGLTGTHVAYSWEQVRRAFVDWRTYIYALMYIGIAQPFYSLALFTPSIIKGLGATNANANLLSVPPYALGFVSTILFALGSDRLCMRGPFIIFGMSIVIVGYIILLTPVSFGVQYFALHLCVIGCCPCIATCITWVGNNFGPTYTRATVMGLFFATGNSAGIVSSNVYPVRTAPRYTMGHSVAIAFSAMAIACAVTMMLDNARHNRARDAQHGRVLSRGKESVDERTGRAVDAFDRARWGLEGLSDDEVVLLGDRHPAYRYIL
ncbi:MFS general substrate transporter [Exidia glandulosa HHB12029]|uniref:MFS general substrate transporter n=1 Tax=Exidia glandulosa HHB12029 TaxID=1314781 RepID=A0A165G278_EXIGL|nr:MFS general substrate transporter [Exidia glandulosa HHB12029]